MYSFCSSPSPPAAAAAGAVVGLGTPVRGCGAPPTVTDGLTGASMPYIFGARYCALLMLGGGLPVSERPAAGIPRA